MIDRCRETLNKLVAQLPPQSGISAHANFTNNQKNFKRLHLKFLKLRSRFWLLCFKRVEMNMGKENWKFCDGLMYFTELSFNLFPLVLIICSL